MIAELRDHQPNRVTPRLRLSDLLASLPSSLPNDFPQQDVDDLVQRAAAELPKYYGGDPAAA